MFGLLLCSETAGEMPIWCA